MCIIAVCENRKLTYEEFENCFNSNKDGVGVAWFEEGKNHYIKGFMTLNSAWVAYETVNVFPHVVHFRNGTSGGVCEELTHPFIVSSASPTPSTWSGNKPLLFHNGVYSMWDKDLILFYATTNRKIPGGRWSDTRYIAILCHYLGRHYLKFASSGKYAYFTEEGKCFMYGNYEQDKDAPGVQFSNSDYKGRKYINVGWAKSNQSRGTAQGVTNGRWWVDEYEDAYAQMGYERGGVDNGSKKQDKVGKNEKGSRKYMW